jgi:UDP-N-acetyl-D-mannosaminuronic acid dehydrogenase
MREQGGILVAEFTFPTDVAIVGGCGRVGLPLALAFADRGLKVLIYDVNESAIKSLNNGVVPFIESGADEILPRVLGSRLAASSDPTLIRDAEIVIVVIGTPVDEHLNPDVMAVPNVVQQLAPNLVPGQLLVLRSTLYPGVTGLVERRVVELGLKVDVAFCPERIAQGRALTELYELPQIVSGRTPAVQERAAKLFRNLTAEILLLQPEEAEVAKLFTNAWRYIKMATANQFYTIANDFGLDYDKIRMAVAHGYPRAADLPGAGFAAGPCLLKDTMQLAAFNNNNFVLGHASMMVNEGLPQYVISRLEREQDLAPLRVGILGMAFKANSDDRRSSLGYKLKRILRFKAAEVLTTDPYVSDDPELVPLDTVLERADLLIVGVPHSSYAELQIDKPVVDIWNLFGNGVRV